MESRETPGGVPARLDISSSVRAFVVLVLLVIVIVLVAFVIFLAYIILSIAFEVLLVLAGC